MDNRGFSLVETVVAVSLVACALVGLAQLFAMSTRANADARRTTVATVLAGQKMEQLRRDAGDLEPGAVGSLEQNTTGFCDFLDEYGQSLGDDDITPPAGTIYVRRWSIEPLSTESNDTLILQVIVRHAGRGAHPGWGQTARDDERLFGGAHLVTMKLREAG